VTLRVLRYGEIRDPMMGHRVAYSAEGEINRKDFGMSFDMLADGKLIVGHEVKFMIELEVVEQTQPQEQEQPTAATGSA
ncbi:MAG: YceI family protein, partial [Chloroflexi bacterium]|nr:YceI family protein [Chloroflexota bacterium]